MLRARMRSGIFRTYLEPEIGRATRLEPTEGRTGRDHPRLGGEALVSTDDRNEKAPLEFRYAGEPKTKVEFGSPLFLLLSLTSS